MHLNVPFLANEGRHFNKYDHMYKQDVFQDVRTRTDVRTRFTTRLNSARMKHKNRVVKRIGMAINLGSPSVECGISRTNTYTVNSWTSRQTVCNFHVPLDCSTGTSLQSHCLHSADTDKLLSLTNQNSEITLFLRYGPVGSTQKRRNPIFSQFCQFKAARRRISNHQAY